MEFYEVIKKRKSTRRFSKKSVARGKIIRILECARQSPSAHNYQPWQFVLVNDQNIINELQKSRLGLFNQAPVIIIACARPEDSVIKKGKEYYLTDVAIAMEHLILSATNEGLATCWTAYLDEERIKNTLKIPDDYRIVALTPLGYASEKPEDKEYDKSMREEVNAVEKKSLQEIIHVNQWGARLKNPK